MIFSFLLKSIASKLAIIKSISDWVGHGDPADWAGQVDPTLVPSGLNKIILDLAQQFWP